MHEAAVAAQRAALGPNEVLAASGGTLCGDDVGAVQRHQQTGS
jgi:hypothetical protein